MNLVRTTGSLVSLGITISALVAGVLLTTATRADDGFEKVRCDRLIIPALVGARSRTPEPVVQTEARRKAIGLQHLGADEVDAGVSTINWKVCGREFVVLDVNSVTRDAVELPAHSRGTPAFSASTCEVAGRTVEGVAIGVFAEANRAGVRMLPTKVAWRIDLRMKKFVPLGATAMCATDGINAVEH